MNRKTKIASALAVFAAVLILAGCNSKIALPENPIEFEIRENDDYISILWQGREYVPYCALGGGRLGACLGYYESGGEKSYICELKGQSSENWIADISDLGNCNEGMIFKEKSVTDIPHGMHSEYEWNN